MFDEALQFLMQAQEAPRLGAPRATLAKRVDRAGGGVHRKSEYLAAASAGRASSVAGRSTGAVSLPIHQRSG